jgi:hypothetical protein
VGAAPGAEASAGADVIRSGSAAPAKSGSTSAGSVGDVRTSSPSGSPAPATIPECAARLDQLATQLAEVDRQRKALDGEPIPPRADAPPRYQERALLHTVQSAFKATSIPGRVDTVDCTEFPCIVFGRVHGDEELVAKLEDSKPFAAYDDDIGVMLTWASGDHARGHKPKQTGERAKPSEISLFAFAWYSDADRAKLGDGIDRRIRARTTDLWNALGPDDP